MARKVTRSHTRRSTPTSHFEPGDVITVQNVGAGAAVAAGRHAQASVKVTTPKSLDDWAAQVHKKIDALPNVSSGEKQDIKQQVDKIKEESRKGSQAETGRLERLLNGLSAMAPDIFDVAITTLANPLAGLGLVAKKVGERAKIERAAARS